jgi:hypothetical protein
LNYFNHLAAGQLFLIGSLNLLTKVNQPKT